MMIMSVRLASTPRQPRQVSRMAETRCSWEIQFRGYQLCTRRPGRAELCGRKGEEFGKFTYLKGSSTFFKEFTWENCGKLGSVLQKCVKVVKTFRVKLVKYFSPGGEESDDDPPRYTQSLASKLAGSRSPHLSLPMREMISSNIWARLTSHPSKASLDHHGHLVALSHRFTALRSNCNYADQLMTSAGLERIILN